MLNENIGTFYMQRDEYGRAQFGCEVNRKTISFFPEMELSEDGIYINQIGISCSIFYISEAEAIAVKKVFIENETLVSNYFEIFVGSEWGPTPKSVYQSVLTLDLTEEERLTVQSKLSQFTFIYLIKDHRTGFTKIGRSNSPWDRLKTLTKQDTLMPEPNNFEIIFAWEDYAYKEKLLHRQFENLRVRGEWFNLSKEDIEEIRDQHHTEKNLVTGKSKDDEYTESLAKYIEDNPDSIEVLVN